MSGITGKTPRVKYPEVTDPPAPPAPPAPPGSATSDRGYGPEAKTETPDTKKTPGDHAWLREWANLKGYDETPMPARALPTGAPTRPPRPTPRFGLREKRAQLETNWKHRGLLRDWFAEQDKAKAAAEQDKAKPATGPARASSKREPSDSISAERKAWNDQQSRWKGFEPGRDDHMNRIHAVVDGPVEGQGKTRPPTKPAQPKAEAWETKIRPNPTTQPTDLAHWVRPRPDATTQPAQPKATTQPAQPTTIPARPAKPAQPPAPGNLPASKKKGRRRSSFQDSFLSPFNPGAPGRRRANFGRG